MLLSGSVLLITPQATTPRPWPTPGWLSAQSQNTLNTLRAIPNVTHTATGKRGTCRPHRADSRLRGQAVCPSHTARKQLCPSHARSSSACTPISEQRGLPTDRGHQDSERSGWGLRQGQCWREGPKLEHTGLCQQLALPVQGRQAPPPLGCTRRRSHVGPLARAPSTFRKRGRHLLV
jgi:hypothetical protein